MGQRLEAAAASAPRIFDDPIDAIDNTAPGEVYYLTSATERFRLRSKASKHGIGVAIEQICTDGRRIYYVQNGELIAATADVSGGADVEWSINLAAQGITNTAIHLTTDGQIVALVPLAPSTNLLLIVDAPTGTSILFAGNPPSAPGSIAADSDSLTTRLLFEGPTQTIYTWTPGPTWTQVNAGVGAGGTISSIYASKLGYTVMQDEVVGGNRKVTGYLFDRGNPSVQLESKSLQYVGDPIGGALREYSARASGGHLYWVPPSLAVPYNASPERAGGAPLWAYDSGRAFAANIGTVEVSAVDDKYLWIIDTTHTVAIEMSTGMIASDDDRLGGHDPTGMCSDGRLMWLNSSPGIADNNRLRAYTVSRQRGYWLRTIGDPSAHGLPLLAVPLTRADGGART